MGHVTLITPFEGKFATPRYDLPMYKIEDSGFSRSRDMKEESNVKIWVIWGEWHHSRSLAMPPFDRTHTTLPLVENMRLSCTVFQI